MKPEHLINKITVTEDTPEIFFWGYILNCWDSFEANQDLRSVNTFVVKAVSNWLIDKKKFINEDEIKWCENVADEDAKNSMQDKAVIRQWSIAYASVTVVMRKFLMKSWNSKENFITNLENKRIEYEQWVRQAYNDSVDWQLPKVSSGERGSVMEKMLKKLKKEETQG